MLAPCSTARCAKKQAETETPLDLLDDRVVRPRVRLGSARRIRVWELTGLQLVASAIGMPCRRKSATGGRCVSATVQCAPGNSVATVPDRAIAPIIGSLANSRWSAENPPNYATRSAGRKFRLLGVELDVAVKVNLGQPRRGLSILRKKIQGPWSLPPLLDSRRSEGRRNEEPGSRDEYVRAWQTAPDVRASR